MSDDRSGGLVAGALIVGVGLVIVAKLLGGAQRAVREIAEERASEHEARERAELRREEEERRAERRSELRQMEADGIDVCLTCLQSNPDRQPCGHCTGCEWGCGCTDD